MREIVPKLTDSIQKHVGTDPVWRAKAYDVLGFRALVEIVAQLAYLNADHLFFFRGQNRDIQSKAGGSTLYPGIYRGDSLASREIRHRFAMLDVAGPLLADRWKKAGLDGLRDIRLKRYIQWSILQHYEVLQTPLLDVTQSLRAACSFAQQDAPEPWCYVYVLGLPHISNRISINSEHDIVNVRLLSICPPAALRPHFQEGYLAGTSDITSDFDSKTELDFRNRLIAKFRIPSSRDFWERGFNVIPHSALYPRRDTVKELCDELKLDLLDDQQPGDLGEFIRDWVVVEDHLMNAARDATDRNVSLREAISVLAKQGLLSDSEARELQAIRSFRNEAVHRPQTVPDSALANWLQRLRKIGPDLTSRGRR